MASSNPTQASVYAQVAIAQALLAVAEELKAYTAVIERKDS
jgi:hypothetical protein